MDGDEERGGPALPQLSKAESSKKEALAQGSINDMIKENTKQEELTAHATKYNLFVDFDSSEPYKGVHKASHRIDINKFGKQIDREVSKFTINNTSAANKLEFKIFRDGSRQSERLRQFGIGTKASHAGEGGAGDGLGNGLIGKAAISLSHLKNFYINKPIGFVCPIDWIQNADDDPQSANYKLENVYVLFTIKVTDKTFGEIILGLHEFRGLPECQTIREMQWRVTVKPTEANAQAVLQAAKASRAKEEGKDKK